MKINPMLKKILVVVMFTVGFIIFIYPLASNTYNKFRDRQLKIDYNDAVAKLSDEKIEQYLQDAYDYNKNLSKNTIQVISEKQHETDKEYEKLLNITGSNIMATVDIPKIAVSLPIYHYSSENSLNKGIGHIYGSSLPVGGEGTHAVLIGHRGLPSSKLFSDLPDLEAGDMFYIKVLNQTLAYEVDRIKVVLPTEVEDVQIVDGQDYVTLVTCTPYGVNTHRILIRGHRVPYNGEETTASMIRQIAKGIDVRTVTGLGFLAFVTFLVVYRRKQSSGSKKPKTVEVEKLEVTDVEETPETTNDETEHTIDDIVEENNSKGDFYED